MFNFLTAFSLAKACCVKLVSGVLYFRMSDGSVKAESDLDPGDLDSAAGNVSPGPIDQMYTFEQADLSAGRWYAVGWASGDDLTVENIRAWAMESPLYWSGNVPIDPTPFITGGAADRAYCYQDAMDHLVIYTNGGTDATQQRLLRKAVITAQDRLTNELDWAFLYSHGRRLLSAPYSEGTVEYTASSRTLTLTGGTFPTWAKYGRVMIDTVIYDIAYRTSDTTLLLSEATAPSGDIAAGTSYVIYRNTYPLPNDFRRLHFPTTQREWYSDYVEPNEFLWLERHTRQVGSPMRWTIMQDPDRIGEFAIFLYGYPNEDTTLDFCYQKSMRPLVYTGYETFSRVGTIAVDASTEVTGTGTEFRESMVGSYLRISSNSDQPDGYGGLNPYAEQRRIAAVESATSLVLDEPVSGTYSGAGYVITDPVEIPSTLHDVFHRGLEWSYAVIGRLERPERYEAAYKNALIKARESNSVAKVLRSPGGERWLGDRGLSSPLAAVIE